MHDKHACFYDINPSLLFKQHPYVGDHFSKLMSPLLLFIDDYEV